MLLFSPQFKSVCFFPVATLKDKRANSSIPRRLTDKARELHHLQIPTCFENPPEQNEITQLTPLTLQRGREVVEDGAPSVASSVRSEYSSDGATTCSRAALRGVMQEVLVAAFASEKNLLRNARSLLKNDDALLFHSDADEQRTQRVDVNLVEPAVSLRERLSQKLAAAEASEASQKARRMRKRDAERQQDQGRRERQGRRQESSPAEERDRPAASAGSRGDHPGSSGSRRGERDQPGSSEEHRGRPGGSRGNRHGIRPEDHLLHAGARGERDHRSGFPGRSSSPPLQPYAGPNPPRRTQPITSSTRLVCKVCSMAFHEREQLRRHSVLLHPSHVCSHCPRCFHEPALARHHEKFCPRRYVHCPSCGHRALSRQQLEQHVCDQEGDQRHYDQPRPQGPQGPHGPHRGRGRGGRGRRGAGRTRDRGRGRQ